MTKLDEMWAALAAYQPQADAAGHGESWRVSKVADETEAEIDFADFLIIAQAVVDKLKEDNK